MDHVSATYYQWHELITLSFYRIMHKCHAPITFFCHLCAIMYAASGVMEIAVYFLLALELSCSRCYCAIDVQCYRRVPRTIIL